MKKTFAFLLAFSLVAGTATAAVNTGGLPDTSVKASAEGTETMVHFENGELLNMPKTDSKYTMEKDGVVLTADEIVNGPLYYGVNISEHGAYFTITAPQGKVLKEVNMTFSLGSMDKIFMDGDTEATSFDNNVRNAVFSNINKNSVTFSNTFGDAVIDSIEVTYDDAPEVVSDYTISIPSTLDVAQAGYNATEGVTAKGTLAKYDKLVITADSDGEFALTSGDNKVRYNLISEEKTEAVYSDTAEAPTWEFTELTDKGVNQPLGVVVENFDDKPAGEYTDTVTFTAKLEDAPIPLQSISLNKSSMVLLTDDGDKTEQLSVTFSPEDTTDDNTVTWSSSDPAVATVDENGVVTTVATGSAVITAKVGDKTASCNVGVNMVTITNSEAPFKDWDTNPIPEFIKDGIVKVSFNSNDDYCANRHDDYGWHFNGYGATVTVTSEVPDLQITKVKFYTMNGSAEVTQAPFTVYSYGCNMYTDPNETGTCFNDWGVNKIEVYLESGGTGETGTETAPTLHRLTLNGSRLKLDDSGNDVEINISETIEYTDDDTWADMVEKYDWLVTYDNSNAPDGKVIHHKTDYYFRVKSSESQHDYNLVSINDKVSAYSAESYSFDY